MYCSDFVENEVPYTSLHPPSSSTAGTLKTAHRDSQTHPAVGAYLSFRVEVQARSPHCYHYANHPHRNCTAWTLIGIRTSLLSLTMELE